MSDLRTRFRTLDGIPVPDLWSDVERRLEAPRLGGVKPVVARRSGHQPSTGVAARPRDMRLAWVASVAVLLVVVATGSFLVGSLQNQGRPTPVPSVLATPAPTVSGTPSPTPAATPTNTLATPTFQLVTRESGFADGPLGRVEWTLLRGGQNSLPHGRIFETPRGLAAIDRDPEGPGARVWLSEDGLGWTVSPGPVVDGDFQHVFSGGEHWLVTNDVHLWHSSDLATWNEVDLDRFRTPTAGLMGFRLSYSFWGPLSGLPNVVSVGRTTFLQWQPEVSLDYGHLAERLGLTLPRGEFLYLSGGIDGAVDVMQQTVNGVLKVGTARIDIDGAVLTLSNADGGEVLASVDATALGHDARDFADQLLDGGRIRLRGTAVTLTDGVARPAEFLDDVEALSSLADSFVALTGSAASGEVWVSEDGQQWNLLGVPDWPVAETAIAGTPVVLDPDPLQPSNSLTIAVTLDGVGSQHSEIWSSDDGLAWEQVAVLPPMNLNTTPYRIPGGYLAFGDNDNLMYVSHGGTEWTAIDRRADTGLIRDIYASRTFVSAVGNTAYFTESVNVGWRKLVRFVFEGAAP